MKVGRVIGLVLVVLIVWSGNAFSQKWHALRNQPSFGASIPRLLTDAEVLVQDGNTGSNWWRFTPDQSSSYINGTWKQAAPLPPGYGPSAFGSAVLRDGRVVIEGGEYNFGQAEWTNLGAIYDPTADVWTNLDPLCGLVLDSGNLCGTTPEGGAHGKGVVFKLTP
jgi:hypothetical protein